MSISRDRSLIAFNKAAAWSMYLMVFVLPFSKSMVEIFFVTALVSVVARKLIARESFRWNVPVDICLGLVVATALISLFNTQYLALSARAFFTKSLKFALLFLVAREALNTREKLNDFLVMAFLSCLVILADGFIQHFVTQVDLLHNYPSFGFDPAGRPFYEPSHRGFPTASFPYPNDFAAWIIMFAFPVAVCALFAKGGWVKRLALGCAALCLLYLLILTKTRAAWLGFLTALVLVPLFRLSLKKALVVALVVALLAPFAVTRSVRSAATSLVGVNDRMTMWKNGWKIFVKHPVIGNGLNTFFVNYMNVREDEDKGKKGGYAHNCYLQMAADTGLAGLGAFLVFVIAVMGSAWRSLKELADPSLYALAAGLMLGLVAFLVHSFFDTNLYSLPLAALFWLAMGVLTAIPMMQKATTT